MLPEDADEHKDRADEYQRERHLGDGPRRKGFDVDVGASSSVVLFVPAGKGGEEEEGDEGQYDGDDAVNYIRELEVMYVHVGVTHSK